MPTYEVWLTRRAQGDLNTARDYIARHAKETADRWYFSFLEALLDLEENPQGRPLAPEDTDVPFTLREFIFRSKSGRPNRAPFTIVG